jgi:hypothetical protein
MGSKGRTEEREITKTSAAKRCKKREQLLRLLLVNASRLSSPNWPLPLSPAPRLARLLHRARISLYVQFRKYGLKRQVQMDCIHTVGAILRT